MSGERTRRKSAPKKSGAAPSASFYVGYVEDEETPEMIMKKFEELEALIKPKSAPATKEQPEATAIASADKPKEEDPGLSEEQLKEVFKRTSMFVVPPPNAAAGADGGPMFDLDDLDLEFADDMQPKEDDVFHPSDDEDWEENGAQKRLKVLLGDGSSRSRRSEGSRRVLAHIAVSNDPRSRGFVIKRKAKTIDPDKPSYVRMPAEPLPQSWAHIVQPFNSALAAAASLTSFNYWETRDVIKFMTAPNITNKLGSFIGILLDPPWLLPGQPPTPGRISIDEFRQLPLPKLLPNGLIFVWVEKELITAVFSVMKTWGFGFVESLAWAKKLSNNRWMKQPSDYFCKSKLSLFFFRRLPQQTIELRHQRNADVIIDFYQPPRDPLAGREVKPAHVYKVIETLLPHSLDHKEGKGKGLLEIWSQRGHRRNGWTTVAELRDDPSVAEKDFHEKAPE